jgi:hypothetical protein
MQENSNPKPRSASTTRTKESYRWEMVYTAHVRFIVHLENMALF